MGEAAALSVPLFTASIEVGVADGDQLALLRSVPAEGVALMALLDRGHAGSVVSAVAEAGFVRVGADGRVRLTVCGRVFVREVERSL